MQGFLALSLPLSTAITPLFGQEFLTIWATKLATIGQAFHIELPINPLGFTLIMGNLLDRKSESILENQLIFCKEIWR